MNSHQLSLEVLDTSNERIFKITDLSVYSTILPVSCPELLITAPGYQYSGSIDPARLTQGFDLVLTACDLQIQTLKCDSEMNILPDGVYAIRYSVSPNEYVYTEINVLRTTQTENRIKKLLCSLDIAECIEDKAKEEKLLQIQRVKMYLASAVAAVGTCKDVPKGTRMFRDAIKLLDRIDCKYCG